MKFPIVHTPWNRRRLPQVRKSVLPRVEGRERAYSRLRAQSWIGGYRRDHRQRW